MMNLFAKPVVSWEEPEAFRAIEDKRSVVNNKWWLRPMALFAFVAMLVLSREIAKITPGKHPPDFSVVFPMIVGVGIFLFYLYPRLLRRSPSSVSLYSSSIMRTGDQSPRSLKEITGYSWSEEGSYYVLRLITKKGRTHRFGVPDPVTRYKIEAVLGQVGWSKIPVAKPDFEARRKATWGGRVFTSQEVQAMRDAEREGEEG